MALFPYQENSVIDIRNAFQQGKRKIIFQLGTGGGKTFIFSSMIAQAIARGKKCVILTDREELFKQATGALQTFNLKPTLLEAGYKKGLDNSLFICMEKTLFNRIKNKVKYKSKHKPVKQPKKRFKAKINAIKAKSNYYQEWFNAQDLIIIDEAHKAVFDKFFKYMNQKTYVIGATATPWRDSNQEPLENFYSEIVEGASNEELQEIGRLSVASYYGHKVDLSKVGTLAGEYDPKQLHQAYTEQKLYNGVIENYKLHTEGKKTLAFSASVESSMQLLKAFTDAGYPAKHLDAKSPNRAEILHWYKNTPNAILCNVDILTTGFDDPETEVIVIYRAIRKSLPLYLQITGRGGRVTATKRKFVILDFGDNVKRFGWWHQKRKWTLKNAPKSVGVAPIKDCEECGAMVPAQAKCCTECGVVFPEKEKKEAPKVVLQELIYNKPKFELSESKNEKIGKYMDLAERQKVLDITNLAERRKYCQTLSPEKLAVVCEMGLFQSKEILHWFEEQEHAKRFTLLIGSNIYCLKYHSKWKNVVRF